jgi:hypothetical protein
MVPVLSAGDCLASDFMAVTPGHWPLAMFGHHLLSLASTHFQLVCLTIGFGSPDIALAWTQQKTLPPTVPLLLSWWHIIYRLLLQAAHVSSCSTLLAFSLYITVYLVMVYYTYMCTAWILPYVFRHKYVDTERDIGFHPLDTSTDAFPTCTIL